jgi:hypothetical protein
MTTGAWFFGLISLVLGLVGAIITVSMMSHYGACTILTEQILIYVTGYQLK